jgi:hypothetical protein
MTRRRVAFLHPDLGLGGAERLVVDAAVELSRFGHTVDMYTAYYDETRCFDETRSGDFAVLVFGGWFPRHVLGRLYALCAVVRCTLAAIYLAMRVWSGNIPDYDVVIVDQVSLRFCYMSQCDAGLRGTFPVAFNCCAVACLTQGSLQKAATMLQFLVALCFVTGSASQS